MKDLRRRLAGIVPATTDVVVIDTPPLEENAGIVVAALRAADVAIVAMAPTMGEYERLPEVWAAIDDVEPLRATPLTTAVLMNRTITNANSTPMFRELITDDGHTVLATTIPRREPIAQAFGGQVIDLGKYAAAADEISMLEASDEQGRRDASTRRPCCSAFKSADLPSQSYRNFVDYVASLANRFGRARLPHVEIIRALVLELAEDQALQSNRANGSPRVATMPISFVSASSSLTSAITTKARVRSSRADQYATSPIATRCCS
ncbi:hypothetical protein KK103_06795 [Curtobacterium flaccumfaciens pv. flaccumfaciens]|uniref:ParA family protein n=1 Tax=Curtobacterium flaccumfaciens pv. flaccumfaciens TaxID=138532 RepID=A0A9Q2W245_9MICO|nr:hypothetical protein [Curtobacterium flaccumfaciens]MBT1541466.1 hypothetical protein [Curtobacterium flaccumfaciens pv. flaccumfaciens]